MDTKEAPGIEHREAILPGQTEPTQVDTATHIFLENGGKVYAYPRKDVKKLQTGDGKVAATSCEARERLTEVTGLVHRDGKVATSHNH
jgi:hypothetical protein